MNLINRKYIDKYLSSLIRYPETPIMKEIRSIAEDKGYPIIRPETAAFLNVITRSKCPKSILEIGTSIGYSGLLMLQAMGEAGHLTTVEIRNDLLNAARSNFEKQDVLNRVTLIQGDGKDILHYLEESFDLIFIDGPKAQYLTYLPDCIRLLGKDGLLICDDVLFYGMVAEDELLKKRKITIVKRMRKFLCSLMESPLLDTAIVPIGDGISVSVRKEYVK